MSKHVVQHIFGGDYILNILIIDLHCSSCFFSFLQGYDDSDSDVALLKRQQNNAVAETLPETGMAPWRRRRRRELHVHYISAYKPSRIAEV
jgi:hypothetical protein